MIGRMAVAGTDPAQLAAATAGCDTRLLLGTPGCHPDLAGATDAVLTAGLGAVAEPYRRTVPIVLAASGPTVAAASRFAARCLDTGRRLRPSESIRMEAAELVRSFGVTSGWQGPCYLLAAVGGDRRQAVLAADALRRRHPAVLVGELLAEPAADGGLAGKDGLAPGALAVVATWEPSPTADPDDHPAAGRYGPPISTGSVLLALATGELAVRS